MVPAERAERANRTAGRCAAALAGLTLAAGAAVYLRAVDPNEPGHYPLCPVRALTGLNCPGCGSLRALHDLLVGDLGAALHSNAVAVLLLPVFVVAGIRAVAGPRPAGPAPGVVAHAVLAGLALWTVARNIPVAPFTYLAPG